MVRARSKTSKLLNSVLIILLMLMIAVSIPQIGILAAGLLILLLSAWLIYYNSISYDRLYISTDVNNRLQ
jgi:hypothetical protein